jgi:hypothetical protein
MGLVNKYLLTDVICMMNVSACLGRSVGIGT